MKNKYFGKITGNLGLKVVAAVIAFLIWTLVTNTNNPVKSVLFTNVPITAVNQDSIADIGKVAELEGSGTVTLKVTERRRVLDRLAKNGSDFYVEADLENMNQMNSVPLTVTCSNPSITWDEIEISPSSLSVTLEDKVEQSFVVSVVSSGKPSGYEVGTTEVVQGKNIYVAGPASIMKIIDQVVVPVNMNGIISDTTRDATLEVIDKNGAKLKDNQLSNLEFKDSTGAVIKERRVQVNIDLWTIEKEIPVVVETTGTPAFGYRVAGIEITPGTISLAGTDEALKALEGKFRVSDKISVAGISENISQEINLASILAQMSGLKLVTDAAPNLMVEVQIEKNGDVTLSVPLGEISLINRPEDMKLVFTPADKISIGIHSVDGDASSLTAEDIKASVDLSPCAQEGNHELAVDVKLPKGYELVSGVKLMVNSEKQAEETDAVKAE